MNGKLYSRWNAGILTLGLSTAAVSCLNPKPASKISSTPRATKTETSEKASTTPPTGSPSDATEPGSDQAALLPATSTNPNAGGTKTPAPTPLPGKGDVPSAELKAACKPDLVEVVDSDAPATDNQAAKTWTDDFWQKTTGKNVDQLWSEYQLSF